MAFFENYNTCGGKTTSFVEIKLQYLWRKNYNTCWRKCAKIAIYGVNSVKFAKFADMIQGG